MRGLILAVASLLCGATAATGQEAEMAMPSWLAGGWLMESPSGSWSEEWWTPPRSGLMMGAGRSGKGASLGWWEHTRIEMSGGKISFCALPKGQTGACFAATTATATEIIFVNEGHDYPQRVSYRLDGDALLAEISLKDGSEPNRWRFKRIN